MNSFLELHSSSDYRVTERDYHTSTWEYIAVDTNQLIPWQINSAGSGIRVEKIDTSGTATDITTLMISGSTLVSSYSKTGGGTWDFYGAIQPGTVNAGGYMESDAFSLTAGESYIATAEPDAYSDQDDFTLSLWKSAAQQWEVGLDDLIEGTVFTVTQTGSDYKLRITNASPSTQNCTAANFPDVAPSVLNKSGTYWSCDGSQTDGNIVSGIFRLRITIGSNVFYSDWCDATGFDDLLKYKVSSSYDFGGVKYSDGYEQWIYKDAEVRRAPRAEIEVMGDSRNGKTIREKVVSAVRYVIRMKVTEPEYEAFVHSIGGTIEITDKQGKTYNAANIEITDPVWYNGNGVVELSFVDEDNINVWSMNNSDL
jgi:hypothetical protein